MDTGLFVETFFEILNISTPNRYRNRVNELLMTFDIQILIRDTVAFDKASFFCEVCPIRYEINSKYMMACCITASQITSIMYQR